MFKLIQSYLMVLKSQFGVWCNKFWHYSSTETNIAGPQPEDAVSESKPVASLKTFKYFQGFHPNKVLLKTYVAETITECDELFEEEFGINPAKTKDIAVAVIKHET